MSDPHRDPPDRNGDTDDERRPASDGITNAEMTTYGGVAWGIVLLAGAVLQNPLVVAGSVVMLVFVWIATTGPVSRPSVATLTDADSWIRLGWVVYVYAVAALIYLGIDDLFWMVFAWFWLLQLAGHRSWVLARLGVGS